MSTGENSSVLRFEDVSVTFGDVKALDGVSFEISAGETRVVLGAAGSGKTVLLKSAIGLEKATQGRIFLFDQEITGLSEAELFPLRSKVGVLFQEGGLFDSLNVEENVAYPMVNQQAHAAADAGVVHERVEETLRFVELEHTIDKFPSELSGGMRRRVGIARANVTEPPLVLYDSPTAGLDPITANNIISLIIKERDQKNTTTVMVTHRYQDGHLAANFRYNPQSKEIEPVSRNGQRGTTTRTIFMVLCEGRLVFEGSQRELEASTDPYVKKFARHD